MSDVVARMRALCEGGWHKGDELWDALAAGAAEIERLRTLLSGAQYREREARNEVAVLRARLDGAMADVGDLRALAARDAGTAGEGSEGR